MNKEKIKELTNLIRKYIDFDIYHLSYSDLETLGLENIMIDLGFPKALREDFWNDLSEEAAFFRDSLIAVNILNMSKLNGFDKIYYITRNFYDSEGLKEWIAKNDLEPKEKAYLDWHNKQVKDFTFSFFKKK